MAVMRLSFELPDGWTPRHRRAPGSPPDAPADAVLISHATDDVLIAVTPLLPKSGFQPLPILEEGRPPASEVQVIQLLEHARTRDGWPMRLATYRFVGEDGAPLETRLAATYEMIHFAAAAVARATDGAAYERRRQEVLAIFTSVRPHLWGAEPVTIAELWAVGDP
jgi:hypothetical protein